MLNENGIYRAYSKAIGQRYSVAFDEQNTDRKLWYEDGYIDACESFLTLLLEQLCYKESGNAKD